MSLREKYTIQRIDYKTAMYYIVEYHYLHRKCPCSFAYGLFDAANDIKGVIVYGTPSSAALRRGICGDEEKDNVIELTRLWVSDDVPKNGESFLIGNTIPLVNKNIIVSYAEPDENHIGYVYQATNWIYTGLSAKRTNIAVEGIKGVHNQTITDKYSIKELHELFKGKVVNVPRPRKHRYVYFNADKRKKKELLKKLKYPILPYPKK